MEANMNYVCRGMAGLCIAGAVFGCGGDPQGSSGDKVGSTSEPIIGGYVDTYDGEVALIQFPNNTFCTGALIAPFVVLTAAHCLTGQTSAVVRFCQNPTTCQYTTPASQLIQNPSFDGYPVDGHDEGIVMLNEANYGYPPYYVSTGAYLWPAPGVPGHIVGDGYTYPGGGGGTREAIDVTVNSAGSYTFNAGGGGKGLCHGDSGGPALYGGTNLIIGVNSFGNGTDCTVPTAWESRVDVDSKWICQYTSYCY
jgi:hypothetical protein